MFDFDKQTKRNVDTWLNGNYDEESKSLIRRLLDTDPVSVRDSFYTSLSFGTGGLRGILGVGTNRINKYTVRQATQGLANYLKKIDCKDPSLVIGYDSRNQSQFFAEETAKVLAGNKIKVYLFDELRPVSLVSYGIRLKKCVAGVMITASHNPPEYNGYKVYWSDGGQLVPPHDKGIIECVRKIESIDDIKVAELNDPLIEIVGDEIDQLYFDDVASLQLYPDQNQKFGKSLNIIYTNLHGSGLNMVPKSLKRWGFTDCKLVEEQIEPNGDFPTVKTPNPEERETLELGVKKLVKEKGDLLLATDPDTDRVGVVFLLDGEPVYLNGNQIGCLCLYHVCEALKSQNKMSKGSSFIKTIVTTELFREITKDYGANCFDVLTGFKYIAEMIKSWEDCGSDNKFIFGAEESYGYLFGDFVRDKDGVISCNLVCEVALHAKQQGKTLIDLLYELYEKYGLYYEELQSIKFKDSKEEKERMQRMMQDLRQNPPSQVGNKKVASIEDYISSKKTFLESNETEKLHLPKSDVLLFWFEDESKLVIRPSGTEPKIKLYCGVTKKIFSSIEEGLQSCKENCSGILAVFQQLLQ